MGDLEWTNDLAIRLMHEYKKRPELWDTSHEMYRVQTLKYETWSELARMFDCDIADLRKKLNSLFASHRREKARVRAGGKSSWFLYPHMSFLPSHIDYEGDGGNNQSRPVPKRSRSRPPVKERSPPALSDNDNDPDTDDNMEEEYLNEDHEEEVVIIKQESPARVIPKPTKPIPRNTHKPRLSRPVKRRVIKEYTKHPPNKDKDRDNKGFLDNRLSETLKLLRKSDLTRRKDECDSFGEYIANSLRKHDERTQSMIKQAINNILFEQEMKKYNHNQYTVVLAGIDENPLILNDHDEEEK